MGTGTTRWQDLWPPGLAVGRPSLSWQNINCGVLAGLNTPHRIRTQDERGSLVTLQSPVTKGAEFRMRVKQEGPLKHVALLSLGWPGDYHHLTVGGGYDS
jgi:hypothetical protein